MGSPNTYTVVVSSYDYAWNYSARIETELRPLGWVVDNVDYHDVYRLFHLFFGKHYWTITVHDAKGGGDQLLAERDVWAAFNRVVTGQDGGAVGSVIGDTGVGAVKTVAATTTIIAVAIGLVAIAYLVSSARTVAHV